MAEDHSGNSWRWTAWLEQYPLNKSTVLDYFKHSDFYDRSCNNEVLAMQQQQQHLYDPSRIRMMRGIEYEVDNSIPSPTYFLIRKQLRKSPEDVQVLALYYILGPQAGPGVGTVFPLPSVHRVLKTGLACFTYYLGQALSSLHDPSEEEVDEKRNVMSNSIDEILYLQSNMRPE